MHNPVRYAVRGVGLALMVATAAGCSSGPQPVPRQPGALVAGTAAITVNDQDLGEFQSVDCTPAGTMMTINTGDQNAGTTTVVSNSDGLVAKAVAIRGLGGFTGSYNENLGGNAEVTMNGTTYSITGTADGFETDKPSFRTNGTFTIKVAC
jgi:hypothetical protein